MYRSKISWHGWEASESWSAKSVLPRISRKAQRSLCSVYICVHMCAYRCICGNIRCRFWRLDAKVPSQPYMAQRKKQCGSLASTRRPKTLNKEKRRVRKREPIMPASLRQYRLQTPKTAYWYVNLKRDLQDLPTLHVWKGGCTRLIQPKVADN